ncbi:MAG: carboxypeptidase regulatory-like domain-containing protein [Lewinellaceae bacterium]|nr:carboxypeptidase regulatory-like domain-containing protein [Lewinellaceae bacterium]
MTFRHFFLMWGVLLLISLSPPAYSQNNRPEPVSFSTHFNQLQHRPLRIKRLPKFPLERVIQEDAINPGTRFAAPLSVDFNLKNSGQWTDLPSGDGVWRLRIQSEDAIGMAVLYDDFYLPPGATLYMYSADRQQVLGPFTSLDNPANGKFLTGFLKGEDAVLEYFEPSNVRGQGRLHLFRVDHAYERNRFRESEYAITGALSDLGFGSSEPCHTNINCAEGQSYQTQKRAACRILLVVEEGTGYCSGTLANNTRNDGTPLLLTAFHCQDGYTPLYDFWRFDFNYEAEGCTNPEKEPGFNSVLGCKLLSGYQASDFLLLQLATPLPQSFNAHFMGWNRATTVPSRATIIHHPRGDIKKIAFQSDAPSIFPASINWDNDRKTPANHHFLVKYTFGTFEVGSSGSSLLDQNNRIVGQLHGGTPNCSITSGYFGRLALSWEGGGTPATRLKDWLDPLNTGAMTTDGIDNPSTGGGIVAGNVYTENGKPIPAASVQLVSNSGFALTSVTDELGHYNFEGVPFGESYEVNVLKSGKSIDGLSTLDLIRVQKHILNIDQLDSPYQMLAADVNNSGTISTLDLIIIRKVILGLQVDFDKVPIWQFLPAGQSLVDMANPFAGIIASAFQLNTFTKDILDFDFIGFKSGDVNDSVDPNK